VTIHVKDLGGQAGSENSSELRHTLRFDAWDDTTKWPLIADLYPAVAAYAPTTFLGLAPVNVAWNEPDDSGHVEFEVEYGSGEPPEGILRIGFDTTGGSVRIRTSRATTQYNATGRTGPDFKGAIEVADGSPQGIDITIPALKIVFRYKWPKGYVQLDDAKLLAGQTGTTNNATFYTFEAGELLFLGASGEIDAAIPNEIEYTCVASANATGLSIGGLITGISKKGHQHLWVAFEDVDDSSAKKIAQRPLAAYVEDVYASSDFSAWGIGS